MRYLQRRMRTGVGTSGRNDCDTLACDLGQRALESILHATAVGLRLPAVKRRAVVFESERDAHGSKKTAALRAAVLQSQYSVKPAWTGVPAPPLFAGRRPHAGLPAGFRARLRHRPFPDRPWRGRAWSPHR